MITNLKEGQTITIRTEVESVKIEGNSCPGLAAYAAGAFIANVFKKGSLLVPLSFIEGFASNSEDEIDWKEKLKDFSKTALKILEEAKR